jgi:hypothetical protein
MANIKLRTRALMSLTFFLGAHLSAAAADSTSALEFTLARLQPGWVVHFVAANEGRQKHICGLVERKILNASSVAVRLSRLPENPRSIGSARCPTNSQVLDSEISKADLIAIDILYADADIFTIPESRQLAFRHPIKHDTEPFEGDVTPRLYETRVKSPPLLPGRYLPEVALALGYAGFLGFSGPAPEFQLSSFWFVHPRFSRWFIRADVSYWGKSQPTNTDVVLPDTLVTTGLGVCWRALNGERFVIQISFSGASIFYRYFDLDTQWAHRAALRAAVSFEWAFRKANVDLHKLSAFIEPRYTQLLNKSTGVADWTKQWAVLSGVRYAY